MGLEFFRAVAHWMETSLRIERDEGDRFGRTLGECDWRAEIHLIVAARREVLLSKNSEQLTKFNSFVRDYGVEELAARLGVNPSAIYHWLRGATSPHPANAIKIQTLARQRRIVLSLDEIYQHFREVHSERYTTSSLKPEPVSR